MSVARNWVAVLALAAVAALGIVAAAPVTAHVDHVAGGKRF